MFCQNCGKELSDGAKFCTACGKPVAGQRVVPKKETYINTSISSKQIHLYYIIAAFSCPILAVIIDLIYYNEWRIIPIFVYSLFFPTLLALNYLLSRKKKYVEEDLDTAIGIVMSLVSGIYFIPWIAIIYVYLFRSEIFYNFWALKFFKDLGYEPFSFSEVFYALADFICIIAFWHLHFKFFIHNKS